MKITFGSGCNKDEFVDCLEMEAFLADLKAVMERHGVCLSLAYHYGDHFLEMQSFTEDGANLLLETLVRSLDGYRGGIPWLDRAEDEYLAKLEQLDAKAERRSAAQREAEEFNRYLTLRAKFEKPWPRKSEGKE